LAGLERRKKREKIARTAPEKQIVNIQSHAQSFLNIRLTQGAKEK
jgi:hypothetical protein